MKITLNFAVLCTVAAALISFGTWGLTTVLAVHDRNNELEARWRWEWKTIKILWDRSKAQANPEKLWAKEYWDRDHDADYENTPIVP